MTRYIGILSSISAGLAFEIKEMAVPSLVEVGSENIVLDCHYNFQEEDADHLEVKWYFNEDPAPFFQWIAGVEGSQPQIIGSLLEDSLDLRFHGV